MLKSGMFQKPKRPSSSSELGLLGPLGAEKVRETCLGHHGWSNWSFPTGLNGSEKQYQVFQDTDDDHPKDLKGVRPTIGILLSVVKASLQINLRSTSPVVQDLPKHS